MQAFIRLLLLCAMSIRPAYAIDTSPPPTSSLDLTAARAKIKAKDWPAAIAELEALSAEHSNADVYNLLAFSLRNAGNYEKARTYYGKALDINPEHRGALEYSGELYLKTGEIERARENLRKLEKICPRSCEELEDLRKAFQAAKL